MNKPKETDPNEAKVTDPNEPKETELIRGQAASECSMRLSKSLRALFAEEG